MDKNGVLAWATIIMIVVGLALIGLGAFRYDDVAGTWWMPFGRCSCKNRLYSKKTMYCSGQ
jgi:hypothetical protein